MIASSGSAINERFKPCNQTYEKLILVSTLNSVSLYGLNLHRRGVRVTSIMNVTPFTKMSYINKLSITNTQCQIQKEENGKMQVQVLCFTEINKVF